MLSLTLVLAAMSGEALTSIDQVIDRGLTFVLAVALVVLVVSGARGWWMWKWTHDEILAQKEAELQEARSERDYYRDFAMRTLNVGEALAARRRTES